MGVLEPPHPAQPWGAGGLTVPLNVQADVGAGRDGRVGGNDTVVLLEGCSNEVLLRVRQELPREQHWEQGHHLVAARDLRRGERGKHRGAEWGQGQLGVHRAGSMPSLQQGGCHLPVFDVSRCPPVTLPVTPACPGHLTEPLVGVVGKTPSSQHTSNWMWHFKDRDQVRLALLCRMRIWLPTEFSGQLRDRFTSVMGELQNHKTPLSQHSTPTRDVGLCF